MKNIYFLLSVSVFIASCGPTTVVQSDSYQPAPVENVSYQSFYDQLSPYGNWISYPGYGYVWMPNAGPDFQPYATNGNWIYTDAGWTWASNYSWGWAPFHYGRWFYENGYGWIWVPGNEWAPAWVSWRGGGDYYGWAPMGPRISIEVAQSNYNPPANYWNFVPRKYMGHPNWHNYYVDGGRNITIINNTTIINNYSGSNRNRYEYAPGPDPDEVRRYSGNNFKPVQIRQANTPGASVSGSQYVIYQPRVINAPATRGDAAYRPSVPAPARYQAFNNVRPSTQYAANNPQAANPGPSTVTRQPSTANPQPSTVNPQPSTSPRPSTANPQPSTVNPQPSTVNPQPSTSPRPSTVNPQLSTVNPQPSTSPKPASRNTTTNPEPTTQPANHAQTTGHPSNTHNPNNGHPTQRTTTHETRPKMKPPSEKPKPNESN